MSIERKGVEFFVGLFLLIGFGVIATMILTFGRFSAGLKDLYPLTVEFPNASGLVKGCDVLISGARVGVVAEAPRLSGSKYAVAVLININQGVPIPRTSAFQIRTNGMLGDAYVDVVPPVKYVEADFAQPGETIAGRRVTGLDELTAKSGAMIDTLNDEILRKLSAELDEIRITTTTLNKRLLNETNLKNIESTFANLETTTSEFSQTARNLDAAIIKAGEVVDAAKGTMRTVDTAAGDLRLAIGDVRKVADSATKTVDSAKVLITKATSGEGTLGTLVADKQTAENLKALIANLRRSGMVFYKDRPVTPEEKPKATPAPPRRR